MRNDRTNPDPSPEQLAAFLDGELDAADRSRVEAWLAGHPAAAAEIDGQRRVAACGPTTRRPSQAPPPGRPLWPASGLDCPCRGRRRLPRTLWLGAGAAAVLLAALSAAQLSAASFPNSCLRNRPDAASRTGVRGRGHYKHGVRSSRRAWSSPLPPVQQAIFLAGQDDVSIMSMESYPGDDGRVPQIGEGDVPMIVAPLARAGGR